MFPEGLVSQSLGHRILLTSHHLNLARSNQMSFPPKLYKLHLFSVIDNAEILPQNSSLGHAVSSLALHIPHLVGSAHQSPALYALFQQNFQCWTRGDVVGEKEVVSQTAGKEGWVSGSLWQDSEDASLIAQAHSTSLVSPEEVKACGSQQVSFSVQCLFPCRVPIPGEGIRWNCGDSITFSVLYHHEN